MEKRLIDRIFDLKSLCRFEEEIGEKCGLGSPEVRCIGALQPGEQVSAGDLADRLSLSPSRASRVITSVREKGLLAEGLDPRDRRAVSISLTAAGEGMRRLIDRKKSECERRLLANFDGEQARAVREGLDMLLAAMKGGTGGRSRSDGGDQRALQRPGDEQLLPVLRRRGDVQRAEAGGGLRRSRQRQGK